MEKTLSENADCDVVLFEGTDMGRFVDAVPDVPKVLDLVDVHSLMALRLATATTETSNGKDRSRPAGLFVLNAELLRLVIFVWPSRRRRRRLPEDCSR